MRWSNGLMILHLAFSVILGMGLSVACYLSRYYLTSWSILLESSLPAFISLCSTFYAFSVILRFS
jgi:hypothetical protein